MIAELETRKATGSPSVDRERGILRHLPLTIDKDSPAARRAAVWALNRTLVQVDPDDAPTRCEQAFGTLRNVRDDGGGLWGDLHFLTSHKQAPSIAEGIELGFFGLRVVTDPATSAPRRVEVANADPAAKPLSGARMEQAREGGIDVAELWQERGDNRMPAFWSSKPRREQATATQPLHLREFWREPASIDLAKFWK